MKKEINALEKNNTWKVTNLPKKKLIGCKWVYRTKYKVDGSIQRYKARFGSKRL